MKEKYEIQIKSQGDYKTRKEFNLEAEISTVDFLELSKVVLDRVVELSKATA